MCRIEISARGGVAETPRYYQIPKKNALADLPNFVLPIPG
jgi:hypothetical protein